MRPVDQTGDLNGQALHRLTRQVNLPDFVKSAGSDEIYGQDGMAANLYAEPLRRRFPVHSGPATYVSTLFFLDRQDRIDPAAAGQIRDNLRKYARFHGIEQSVLDLEEQFAKRTTKTAAAREEDYGLILEPQESPSGSRELHCPLRNAQEVKAAAQYLQKHRAAIPYRHRHGLAGRILEKADEYGAGLPNEDFVEQQAGHGVCSAKAASELLRNRAQLMRAASRQPGQNSAAELIATADHLDKIAQAVAEQPSMTQNQDDLVKLASLLDDADRELELGRFVIDLTPAEEVLFGLTAKQASQAREQHIPTVAGNVYAARDLERVGLAELGDVLGKDFADAVTSGLQLDGQKLAEIVPTLPRGDAELLERYLDRLGIKPIAKTAAAEPTGFSDQDLAELAGHFRR
jgi:hypothetical protein